MENNTSEVTGKLIEDLKIQVISDKFQKREFVLELENKEHPEWNQFRKLQLTQDRCDILDKFKIGDNVKVSYNLRGRRWEKDGKVSYFNSDEAWRIEDADKDDSNTPPVPEHIEPEIVESESEVDTLPF